MCRCGPWNKISVGMVLWLLASWVLAQTYPSRPVRVILPYGPDTGVAIITRLVTEELAKNLGQPFVTETRPGAGGAIATAYVAAAPADGYTILSDTSAHTAAPALRANLPYDTERDLAGVTTLVELPIVMVIARSKGITSIRELIAAAKAKPGSVTFASGGVGTSAHLAIEKLRMAAGFEALHIPFKSSTESLTEVMTGRIDFVYTAIVSGLPGIRDGKLVALALSSKRSSVLPDVPTIEEAGVPNSAYPVWVGVVVAAKTPKDIISRLNQEIVKVLATTEMKERLVKIGAEPWSMRPEQFDTLRHSEISANKQIVKSLGIQVQ